MEVDNIIKIKEIQDIDREQEYINWLYTNGYKKELENYIKDNILKKYEEESKVYDALHPIPASTYEEYVCSAYNFLENMKRMKEYDMLKKSLDFEKK